MDSSCYMEWRHAPNLLPMAVRYSHYWEIMVPYPSTGPAGLSRTQLLIPQGYYFIQTGPADYDMVSALDAKAWISWQF